MESTLDELRGGGPVARQNAPRPVVTSIQERFVAELVGTALLTFIGTGAIAAALTLLHNSGPAGGQFARPSDYVVFALAQGLALAALIAIFVRVSGAHFNPAVTLGLASIQRFPLEDVFPYLLAQFLGAILGAAAILLVYGTLPAHVAVLGAPRLGTNISIWQGLLGAGLGAFFWVLAFLATVVDERAAPGWAGLTVGFAVASAILMLTYGVGATFNPAASFGTDLLGTIFGGRVDWLAYVVSFLIGPLIGGVVAAFLYRYVARLPRVPRARL